MLKSIIARKIKSEVKTCLETLDIREILETAADSALENYDIAEEVLDKVEDTARSMAHSILMYDFEEMVEEAVEDEFEVEEY